MIDVYGWRKKFELCRYSNRLLTKLLVLNETANAPINIKEIQKAIYYAKKYHGNQKRDTGEPYYSHPIEVAYLISDYIFTTDILITSILHDTMEDTLLTKEMITCIFSSTIAKNVADLTRIKTDRKITSAEIIKSLYLQNKKDLLLIKIFDRIHNMQTIKIKGSDKNKETIHETVKRFVSIIMYLRHAFPNMLLIENELMSLCLQNFSKDISLSTEEFFYGQEILFEENYRLAFPSFQNVLFPDSLLYLSES